MGQAMNQTSIAIVVSRLPRLSRAIIEQLSGVSLLLSGGAGRFNGSSDSFQLEFLPRFKLPRYLCVPRGRARALAEKKCSIVCSSLT